MKQLEYGKWYSIDECMPEFFEELVNRTYQVQKKVLVNYETYGAEVNYRMRYNGEFSWCYNDEKISHWMAIPPIKMEEDHE